MILQIPEGYAFTASGLKSAVQKAGQSILNPLSESDAKALAYLLLPWNIKASDMIKGGHEKVVACVCSYFESDASAAISKWFKSAVRKDYSFVSPVTFFTVKCSNTAEAFGQLGAIGVLMGLLGVSLSYEVKSPSLVQGIRLLPTSASEVSRWARLHWDYKAARTDSLFHLPVDSAIDYLGLRIAKKIASPVVRYAQKLRSLDPFEVIALSADVRGLFVRKAEAASWMNPSTPAIFSRQITTVSPFAFRKPGASEFCLVESSEVLSFLLDEKAEKFADGDKLDVWYMSETRLRDQDSLMGAKHAMALFTRMAGLGSITQAPIDVEHFGIDTATCSLIDLSRTLHSPVLRHQLGSVAGFGTWGGSIENVGAFESMDRTSKKVEACLLVPVTFKEVNGKGGDFHDEYSKYLEGVGIHMDDDKFVIQATFHWFSSSKIAYECAISLEDTDVDEGFKAVHDVITSGSTFTAFKTAILTAEPKEVTE